MNKALGCGWVVRSHFIEYLAPALLYRVTGRTRELPRSIAFQAGEFKIASTPQPKGCAEFSEIDSA